MKQAENVERNIRVLNLIDRHKQVRLMVFSHVEDSKASSGTVLEERHIRLI